MVESHFAHWDRILFRDYLTEHPDVAREYGNLKKELSGAYQKDRIAYTEAKSDFISRVTETARRYYGKIQQVQAPDALPRAGDKEYQ
jgi:GrpB-like predicted nucleotidyltransferase (UPF0157 family)